MKILIITGLTAISVLLIGCGKSSSSAVDVSASPTFTTVDTALKAEVDQSPIIVYAKIDTNSLPDVHFVVAEVWKGFRNASAAGCDIGTQISHEWPAKYGALPDGAILFYRRSIPATATFETWAFYPVRGGHIGGTKTITIQQFKTAFGL